MTKLTLAVAGNTLAPALAVLGAKGYSVQPDHHHPGSLRATCGEITLLADDPLALLGLAAIVEARGPAWHPTDSEVAALLALEG